MQLPDKTAVPLRAFVNDSVDEQCRTRGITFGDLDHEAVEALTSSLVPSNNP
jgi:hypothetical protein